MKTVTILMALCFALVTSAQNPTATVKVAGTLPVIDGVVDNVWAGVEKMALNNPGGGATELPDAADYSCTWSALWSGGDTEIDSIYLLIEVTDELFSIEYPINNQRGHDDNFDLVLNPGLLSTGEFTKPYRVGLINGNDGYEFWFTYDANQHTTMTTNLNKSYSIDSVTYVYEIAIGINDFDTAGVFAAGYQFGIDIRYNDDDKNIEFPGTKAGTFKRDGQYSWSLGTEGGTGAWNFYESCGVATFSAEVVTAEASASLSSSTAPSLRVAVCNDVLTVFDCADAAVIYNIAGLQQMTIANTSEATGVAHLADGIYILKTAQNGVVKFIK